MQRTRSKQLTSTSNLKINVSLTKSTRMFCGNIKPPEIEINLLSCRLCVNKNRKNHKCSIERVPVLVTRHHRVSDLDMVQETEVTMKSDGLQLRQRDNAVEDEARGCKKLDV